MSFGHQNPENFPPPAGYFTTDLPLQSSGSHFCKGSTFCFYTYFYTFSTKVVPFVSGFTFIFYAKVVPFA